MLFALIVILLVAGGEVLGTTPRKPPSNCLSPAARDKVKPLKCGPNSYFESCSRVCPPKNCSSLLDPYWLCESPCCVPECRCFDGYFRDDRNGNCISRDECLAQCGPAERFVKDSMECQKTCANYKVTGPQSLCKPFTGCVCAEGRVRLNDNATGECVLPQQCPRRQCPLHEHNEDCPSVCVKETCMSRNADYKCLLPAIPFPCKPRCICDKGYLRTHLGQCVKESHCPTKKCPVNEEWRCASMCPWDSCKSLDPGFKCPPGIISACIPACVCKDGFLRNENGHCVRKDLCPKSIRCGINEVAVKCKSYLPQTCESVYTLYRPIENPPCTPGCDCRPGYLRNKYNICVPSECCPAVPQSKCGPNQEYKKCGSSCAPSCDDLDNPPRICPAVCVEGCFCKDGYLKDDHGNCVTRDECPLPICNKPNEVAKDCGSYCEIKTCEDYNRTDISCPAVCVRGCFCRKGLVRNAYGVCIPPKKCPPQPVCLQENEEYQPCGSSCPDTCDNYQDTDRICTANCVASCNCKAGYVRNLKDNTCIKPEQCPSKECSGENEEFNLCASYCPVTCANRFTQGDWACITLCREACDCISGTLRNDSGKCVPVEQCTPPVCRENEKYMKCGTACPPTYDNYKTPLPCTRQCVEDCFCKEGYVRDRYMRCVKPEDCEPICPAGEKFSVCSAHCQDTCENYNQTNRICTYQCQSGCVCEEGTVRRKDGKCVIPNECSIIPTCPADEVYDPCSAHCEPTCENNEPNRPCTAICKPGCKCADGLVRRKDGKCVKLKECQPECPVNEQYVNCVIGLCKALSCDQLGFPIACPGILGHCDGGCVCIDNYVRASNNTCIPQQNCLSCGNDFNATVGCGINCGRLCTNYKNPPNCNIPQPCRFNACDCKKGYVYDIVTERCLAPVDCPVPCKGDLYAEKVKCPNPCAPTCAKPTTEVCSKACLTEGCQCRTGYILHPNGNCVSPENCPDNLGCNGDINARVSSCVTLCQPRCGVGPIFCPAFCRLGCVCKPGYIMSETGDKCIKSEECVITTTTETSIESTTPVPYEPPTPTSVSDCGQQTTSSATEKLILCVRNEIWIDCKAGYCKPQYCRDLNKNLTCPQVMDPCPGGCICRDGLLRNEDEICIPKDRCPISKPCPDPNAIRKKCASHESCRATCAVPNSKVCPKICIIDGCECKQGYVLSAKGGKCVRIEECPQQNVTCNGDTNAVITAFPPPCPSTCDLPNGVPNCLKLGLDVGCVCKPGYIKSSENGTCILPDQCKGGNPCGANGTFAWCRVNCFNNYCPVDESRAIIACDPPYPCPSGCVCKLNYRMKSVNDDRCILSSTCPPLKCTSRPNEIWDPCMSPCLRENCADVNNQPTTCNTLVLNCQPQCVCKKGYFRNESDICIPAKQCPGGNQPCDDPNAERLECAPAPSCRSTCANPNPSPCILSCAVNQCVCKKGFVLSVKGGKCIPVDQCPKDAPCNGDSNAVIKANPIPCPSTCSAPNANPWCKKYAPPVGCECKPGYLLAEAGGKCIKPDECPGGNPCGINGTFAYCNVNCPTNTCPVSETRGIIACSPPYPCPSGCACKLNYKRSNGTDSKCILAQECPPLKCTSRPNEIWDPCMSPCLRENCADVNNQPTTCNTLVLNCQPQCVCKKGYFRNESDICIPAKQCPGGNQPCDDPNAERLECAPAPSCRSTCANPNPSPCILSCAVNQCVCKKGFVLSEKGGKCIPVDQCPKDAPCNGDSNAVIKANPIPCPSTCSAPNASPWCKKYAPPVGCECKPGYLLAEDGGKCIKPEECPGGNPCGINGTFAYCNVNCPTNTCPVSETRAVIACSPTNPCPSGCACKLNYKRRNSTDSKCILAQECPPLKCTSRPNEIWNPCISACLRENCADVNNQATTCNTLVFNCQPQCVCKKGYFRNDSDICVPARQCPQNQLCSDPNAERVQCAPSVQCRPTCAKRNPGPCIEICVLDDCVCKKGFILAESGGKCIPENQCPVNNQCSDPNAERVECALATECRATCSVPNPGPCIHQICVKNDCVCKKGYILSEKGGKCITADQCPTQKSCNGDPNAQIKECPLPCPATCDAPNAIPCRKACVPIGCECKAGYILSESNGKCILPEKCKGGNPCGRNETFVPCKVPCSSDYCPVNNSPNRVICETPDPCLPGCVCKINYRRRSVKDQRCMYASECPPIKCDINEDFSGCPSDCLQEDCSNVNDPPAICNTLLLNCQPKCICKKGYYRDSNRKCIPAKQCPPPKCGIHEHYEWNRIKCELTCNNYKLESIMGPCQPTSACFCDQGFVRSEDGKCIPKETCPIQCKPNEVFRKCRIRCPPQFCSSSYTDYDCRNATQCEPGCDCIDGYLRNGTENDICIPNSQCPTSPPIPECGINEHYESNRNKCDLTCENCKFESTMGACQETSACFCDEGFARNDNGLCIPKEKCPQNIVCPKNEVVSQCYNSCHKTCKTRLRSDGRVCHLACIETGCLCVEGYLRHDNGTCVPVSECSPPRCNENESYSSCGTACPPTCQNRGDNCTACTDQCVEDCFCNKGFVRFDDGSCVKPKDCPPRTCSDCNETFQLCPATCPPTDGCSNIWSKFNCTNEVKCCKPQCRCKSGYFRNNEKKCVPSSQC